MEPMNEPMPSRQHMPLVVVGLIAALAALAATFMWPW